MTLFDVFIPPENVSGPAEGYIGADGGADFSSWMTGIPLPIILAVWLLGGLS